MLRNSLACFPRTARITQLKYCMWNILVRDLHKLNNPSRITRDVEVRTTHQNSIQARDELKFHEKIVDGSWQVTQLYTESSFFMRKVFYSSKGIIVPTNNHPLFLAIFLTVTFLSRLVFCPSFPFRFSLRVSCYLFFLSSFCHVLFSLLPVSTFFWILEGMSHFPLWECFSLMTMSDSQGTDRCSSFVRCVSSPQSRLRSMTETKKT